MIQSGAEGATCTIGDQTTLIAERQPWRWRICQQMIPEKIGKYTVIELLGRGGMGEVYLGEDPYIGRRVAIKIIKGADPQARDRFRHEARVIGGLAHPAIVSLLDFDFLGDEPFLVMEYLKGQGLDAWIQDPHTLAEQLVVLEDLCQALAYAHENGVLHRDVKPSNVQILPNGRAKLMDFGIARGSAGKLTATGAVMGTPEYMAPEILNDAAYSARSDLYACAGLLYEMFTGSNPFAAKTLAATLTNILTLNPPDLRSVRPDLPAHLAQAIMACLRKEPEQRPEGFDDLIAAAREARGGPSIASIPETRAIPQTPVAAPDPPTAASPSKEAEPAVGKMPWAWVGGAGAAVAIGLIWVLNPGPSPPVPAGEIAATPLPTPVSASATPGTLVTPSPMVEPTVTPTPQPRAAPAATPRPTRVASPEATPASTPAARQSVEAPAPPPSLPTATPLPRVSPSTLPSPTATPQVAAPVLPQEPNPTLSAVSPRTVRRGSSVVLDIEGKDLRPDLIASVLQGRRPAAGIKVVRQEFVSSSLFRVTLLIEPEVPLLSYTVVFRGASGALTHGVQIEVVL